MASVVVADAGLYALVKLFILTMYRKNEEVPNIAEESTRCCRKMIILSSKANGQRCMSWSGCHSMHFEQQPGSSKKF